MTAPNWEDVNVPRGAYIGWGEHVGQHVTGRVLDYQPTGGTDFDGNVCPQLSVELTEPAASFNKQGERTDYPAGDLVVLNAGQASLKRAIKAADPSPGDLVKITLESFANGKKGLVKEFGIKIARGATPPPAQPSPFQQHAPAAPAQPFQQAVQPAPAAPAAKPFGQAPAAPPAANPFGAPATVPDPWAAGQPTAQPPF